MEGSDAAALPQPQVSRGVRLPPRQDRGAFDRRDYSAVCLELWLQQFAPDFRATSDEHDERPASMPSTRA